MSIFYFDAFAIMKYDGLRKRLQLNIIENLDVCYFSDKDFFWMR